VSGRVLAAILALAIAAPASAQEQDPPKPKPAKKKRTKRERADDYDPGSAPVVVYKKKTVIELEDVSIDGNLLRPTAFDDDVAGAVDVLAAQEAYARAREAQRRAAPDATAWVDADARWRAARRATARVTADVVARIARRLRLEAAQ
jgi:hypothetical protein